MLELDLASRADDDSARPLLTALAHAKGDGLPLTLLSALIPVFVATGQTVTPDTVTAALAANRFYLRSTADTDGTTLYRLFHQGLTDHLLGSGAVITHTPEQTTVFDRLLATVPGHR